MKVASALFLLTVVLVHAQAPTPPVPGRLVDLGGYRLHLNCSGRGKPTVVFSPGAGDFSFDWYLVQSEVAKFTRACSYDRGGEAWSDLGPTPRTIHQEAYDVGRLLHKAKEKGPFVLVGQSAGGPVIRLFQQRYPQDVTAMVLVDAFHEDGRLFINGKLQKLRDLAKDRPVPQVRDHSGPGDGLSDEGIAKIKEAIVKYDLTPGIDPPFDKLPPEIQKLRLWALAKYSHFVALDNDFNAEETETFFKDRQQNPQPLGDIPLIVLSRSRDDTRHGSLNSFRPSIARSRLNWRHSRVMLDRSSCRNPDTTSNLISPGRSWMLSGKRSQKQRTPGPLQHSINHAEKSQPTFRPVKFPQGFLGLDLQLCSTCVPSHICHPCASYAHQIL